MRGGALSRVLPLYLVVFVGFVGYSLMITVFTPLFLRDDGGLLPSSTSQRRERWCLVASWR